MAGSAPCPAPPPPRIPPDTAWRGSRVRHGGSPAPSRRPAAGRRSAPAISHQALRLPGVATDSPPTALARPTASRLRGLPGCAGVNMSGRAAAAQRAMPSMTVCVPSARRRCAVPPPSSPTIIGSTTVSVNSAAIARIDGIAAGRQHLGPRGRGQRMVGHHHAARAHGRALLGGEARARAGRSSRWSWRCSFNGRRRQADARAAAGTDPRARVPRRAHPPSGCAGRSGTAQPAGGVRCSALPGGNSTRPISDAPNRACAAGRHLDAPRPRRPPPFISMKVRGRWSCATAGAASRLSATRTQPAPLLPSKRRSGAAHRSTPGRSSVLPPT